MQELTDMTTAESVGAITWKPETTSEEMLNSIGDSLSDRASSVDDQNGEDEEDDEEDTEVGKMSDDDEPGWVMGTISKTVPHHMERSRQKQRRLDEVTQLGWGDAANYFCKRDMRYGTAEMRVLAVVKPKIDTTAATPPRATFREHIQTPDIRRGKSRIPAVSSRPGSSQMRLGSEKLQLHKFLPVHLADTAPNSTVMQDAKPGEPVSV